MNILTQLAEKLAPYWEADIEVARNEYLTVAGDLNTQLYFVESGSLRVFIEDEHENHTIRFGYQQSFLTALDSFLKEVPTVFHIQALKKSRLKVISKAKFLEWVHASQEHQLLWNKLLEEFVYQQLVRENDLILYTPQKRVERVLKRSPQLFQEIPQKHIASYLRMTPETISRILKNLD